MHRDRALGLAALALSGAYYWMATSLPQSRLADAVGAGGLPRVYAIILAALALILIVRSRGPWDLGFGIRDLSRIGGMVAIGAAYVVVVPWLGYLLSIAGLILATTYYQGGTVNRSLVVVALGGGIFFWLLFVVFMGIPQPAGWFPPQL